MCIAMVSVGEKERVEYSFSKLETQLIMPKDEISDRSMLFKHVVVAFGKKKRGWARLPFLKKKNKKLAIWMKVQPALTTRPRNTEA